MKKYILFFIILLSLVNFAHSMSESDEMRLNALYESVRCPACGGQSIKDSNSQIAVTLRDHIKREVLANKTDEQIKEALINSYGEQIINDTKISLLTSALWLVPLAFAAWLLFCVRSFFYSKSS